jgi:hypothetical protein
MVQAQNPQSGFVSLWIQTKIRVMMMVQKYFFAVLCDLHGHTAVSYLSCAVLKILVTPTHRPTIQKMYIEHNNFVLCKIFLRAILKCYVLQNNLKDNTF